MFDDRKTELKICRIFETRHIIVHRAGLIDQKFKKVTKSRDAINTQVRLSRRYVLNSIKILTEIVQKIEAHVKEM